MIPLHRLFYRWDDSTCLEIEWSKGNEGELVEGFPIDNLSEMTGEEEPDRPEIPAICLREDENFLFEPLQLREQTEYIVAITLPINLEEGTSQYKARRETGWPFLDRRVLDAFNIDPPRYWETISDSGVERGVRIKGRLNFGGHIGIANLSIINASHKATFEVACMKIGYFKDFKQLLEDISKYATDLILEVDQITSLSFGTSNKASKNYAVALFHLRRLMSDDNLPEAIRSILQNPHNRLVIEEEVVPIYKASYVDPASVVMKAGQLPTMRGGPLQALFKGTSPTELPQVYKFDSFDTPENRFVKMFLQELIILCTEIMELIQERRSDRKGKDKKGKKEKYISSFNEVKAWQEMIAEWLSYPFWHNVGEMKFLPSNSQVLQKRSDYKQVLEAMISLQFGMNLPWEAGATIIESEAGDIRPIYRLYEFWCFLVLRSILTHICGPEISISGQDTDNSNLIRFVNDGLEINLARGKRSRCPFEMLIDKKKYQVNLFYNRAFTGRMKDGIWQGSYSIDFYPDFSIQIKKAGNRNSHWVHFDAKYRLDFLNWENKATQLSEVENELSESAIEQEEKDIEGVFEDEDVQVNQSDLETDASDGIIETENLTIYKQTDLYKMHTYRDAILGTRGAYVLFPGNGIDKTLLVRNPTDIYKHSFDIPGIGAFPIKPQGDPQQISRLEVFIRDTITALANASAYTEEEGIK